MEALAGLRAPAHALFLDGTQLDEVEADSLRRQFALVPQDPMLLMGTVADNLRIAAPSLDERAMHEALEVACLDRRVAQAPDGLDPVYVAISRTYDICVKRWCAATVIGRVADYDLAT